jgi:catechol-2,3-dioxygenase
MELTRASPRRIEEQDSGRSALVRSTFITGANTAPADQETHMIPVARLNHAVLYVRDAEVAADFYARVFGFEVVEAIAGRAVFMRAGGGSNHHDLGLFSVGPQGPRPPRGSTGLYHLAWEVPTIEDLVTAAEVLQREGALGGATDHGVSKSLYGADPDGNEFEIMWRVPREAWTDEEAKGTMRALNLPAEVARWGGDRPVS